MSFWSGRQVLKMVQNLYSTRIGKEMVLEDPFVCKGKTGHDVC